MRALQQANRAAPNAVTLVSRTKRRYDLGRNCSLLMLNGLMPFGHKCHALYFAEQSQPQPLTVAMAFVLSDRIMAGVYRVWDWTDQAGGRRQVPPGAFSYKAHVHCVPALFACCIPQFHIACDA
jgi:hypothetical protein